MNGINLFLLAILSAGHAELMVGGLNRLYGWLPLRKTQFRMLRGLHNLSIVAFPVVVFFFVGIGGPQLLDGGSWTSLPVGWAAYFVLCAVGVLGLLVSVIRHFLHTIPPRQLSNHSRTVDIEQRLGYRPVKGEHRASLSRLPGNEILQIQVSDKVFQLPNLPPEWDGLSILHLSDLHITGALELPFFEQLAELSMECEADLIAFTGDLLDDERLMDWIPQTLGKLSAPLGCYFVLGNHDWLLDHERIRDCLVQVGWQSVAGKTIPIEHQGRSLVIGGTERPWMGKHPDFSDVPDDAFRLLLSHTPDQVFWAQQSQIDLIMAGHVHGGQIVLPGIGPVYAPSRYGTRFVGGAYWMDPTMLYVSRGISGDHTLRWNCPPELTRLVLSPA